MRRHAGASHSDERGDSAGLLSRCLTPLLAGLCQTIALMARGEQEVRGKSPCTRPGGQGAGDPRVAPTKAKNNSSSLTAVRGRRDRVRDDNVEARDAMRSIAWAQPFVRPFLRQGKQGKQAARLRRTAGGRGFSPAETGTPRRASYSRRLARDVLLLPTADAAIHPRVSDFPCLLVYSVVHILCNLEIPACAGLRRRKPRKRGFLLFMRFVNSNRVSMGN